MEARSSYEFASESMSSRLISDLDLGSRWLADLGSRSAILLLDMGSGSLVLVLERSLAICQVSDTLGWFRFLGVWITSFQCAYIALELLDDSHQLRLRLRFRLQISLLN